MREVIILTVDYGLAVSVGGGIMGGLLATIAVVMVVDHVWTAIAKHRANRRAVEAGLRFERERREAIARIEASQKR